MHFSVERLIKAAAEARENAYAPYSNFKVGAAILTKGHRCYTGCNVENASYGLTCCAERVALFKAVASNERDFTAIALTAGIDQFISPCGACRQVLAEFSPNIEIYMANKNGEYVVRSLAELLPDAFKLAD
ncbi:MAG: cytidine deaminase [Peptococcaceae bacterium]|nr:cytidine deaminase [Candidatus Syntrophopropionicum ammoniitolerans]